jgi:hypothetical protein
MALLRHRESAMTGQVHTAFIGLFTLAHDDPYCRALRKNIQALYDGRHFLGKEEQKLNETVSSLTVSNSRRKYYHEH